MAVPASPALRLTLDPAPVGYPGLLPVSANLRILIFMRDPRVTCPGWSVAAGRRPLWRSCTHGSRGSMWARGRSRSLFGCLGRARGNEVSRSESCLLYTSDAADDLLCVDLGGRR